MIFLDSSFLIAFYNPKDKHRTNAINTMKDILKDNYGPVLISDYVFDEIVTVIFNRNKKLSIAIDAGEKIRKSVRIVGIDKDLFESSWKIFKNQKNTNLSFTDCSILAVMEQEGVKNIATYDKDFKKIEGIRVIE